MPRKNVARLLRAFDVFRQYIKEDFRLVIAGANKFGLNEVNETLKNMAYKDSVLFVGRKSPDDLKKIVASAFALTYIPVFEGFGIPILEAFYCNVPVITSNVTSMPEVAGDAAILIDPYSVDSIKNGMLELYHNQDLCKGLVQKAQERAKMFTWDKTANNLWQGIEKVPR
ncbi:MAG: glycosyltransferase family 4 protein [Bacteroidales bacterium]|nr:glycosyltransferase family 4 protein [Bacteroidales bacterium]